MKYSETEPPDDPAAAKKRRMLAFTIGALVVSAALVAFLPLKLPTPLRIAVAGIDLIAAAVVFVAYRQHNAPHAASGVRPYRLSYGANGES